MTTLKTPDVKVALAKLGYYDGPIDDNYLDPNYRADLKVFQRDYPASGTADGWYGAKTEAQLLPLVTKLQAAPCELQQCRRWHCTGYYVGNVKAWSGPLVPMMTPQGSMLARMPAGAFAEAALEGATKLADGRLVGVAHPAYSACSSTEFAPVYDIAKRNGWIPDRPGYAGITLSPDASRAAMSRNFELRKSGPKGWPLEQLGIECDPYRTLAADLGTLPKHDPQWKGKGGVVPVQTRVFILELVDKKLPDGTTHDGWCVVNDTGGGIYGAHFDIFTGSLQNMRIYGIPSRAHVWFEGIEKKLPMSYAYGL